MNTLGLVLFQICDNSLKIHLTDSSELALKWQSVCNHTKLESYQAGFLLNTAANNLITMLLHAGFPEDLQQTRHAVFSPLPEMMVYQGDTNVSTSSISSFLFFS